MINSFSKFLIEEEKQVFFTFGRMNPPTIGHEKLLDKLAQSSRGSSYRVYLSQSQDNKKNPLPYVEKVKIARKMFPRHARSIMLNKKVKTIFEALTTIYNEGFANINDDFNDVLLFGLMGIFFLIFTDYIYKLGRKSY